MYRDARQFEIDLDRAISGGMKWAALILVAIVVHGGSIAFGLYLRRRWLDREAAKVDTLIRPVRPVFEKLPPSEADAMRAEASRRHAAQSYRQKQSAQIASGVEPAESKQIRIVR